VPPPLEIGRSLREARLARGASLESIEAKTRIRTRYLAALEEERFDELPGEAYAKGFLRTYADHLGLDGQECLALYHARRRTTEEPPVAPRPQRLYEPPRLRAALAGLVAALLLTVLSLAAWRLGNDEPHRAAAPLQPKAAPAPPPVATVAVVGTSRLELRIGTPQGRRLWSGTLRTGQRLRLGLRRPIWLRASAPERLRLVVDGRPMRLPPGAATVVVTARAARPA
jgi:hypothetical protein